MLQSSHDSEWDKIVKAICFFHGIILVAGIVFAAWVSLFAPTNCTIMAQWIVQWPDGWFMWIFTFIAIMIDTAVLATLAVKLYNSVFR